MEEGKDDVKSVWPLWAGLHSCYNGNNNKLQKCQLELILKNYPSPDCRLQLVYMKLESLVIANHHVAVNQYFGLAHTARHMQEINSIWNLGFLLVQKNF